MLVRPLFVAFLIGCTVSLLTSATLTARLVIPATIYWSCIPLVQVGSLCAVCWRDRTNISLGRLVDRFFRGYTPWFVYLLGLSVIWAFLSPANSAPQSTIARLWLFAGAIVASLWSLYIDFQFFRFALKRTAPGAARDLVVQRLISWSVIVFIIGAPTAWSEVAGRIVR